MLNVTIDKMDVENAMKRLKVNYQLVILLGANEGVRSAHGKHFYKRQKAPRKDGLPKQGFWHGNKGQSVAEKIQPTTFAKDEATIRIESAPLAHKLNPSPPPIKSGAGEK